MQPMDVMKVSIVNVLRERPMLGKDIAGAIGLDSPPRFSTDPRVRVPLYKLLAEGVVRYDVATGIWSAAGGPNE